MTPLTRKCHSAHSANQPGDFACSVRDGRTIPLFLGEGRGDGESFHSLQFRDGKVSLRPPSPQPSPPGEGELRFVLGKHLRFGCNLRHICVQPGSCPINHHSRTVSDSRTVLPLPGGEGGRFHSSQFWNGRINLPPCSTKTGFLI